VVSAAAAAMSEYRAGEPRDFATKLKSRKPPPPSTPTPDRSCPANRVFNLYEKQ